jgi:hypothetical protein
MKKKNLALRAVRRAYNLQEIDEAETYFLQEIDVVIRGGECPLVCDISSLILSILIAD